MASSVVGVDIGSTSLRAIEVASAGKARPTVVRHHEVPLPDGAVSRGEVLEPNTVAATFKHLWSTGGFKSKFVVLGMGNQRVLARDLTVPKMSRARIRESLPFHVQDMLPVPVADALLDFYPVSESDGENGPMVSGLLVAAVKDAVLGNVRAAQLAGLTTVDVDLIPFALSRLLISRAQIPETVALIDLGANTTSVVIATGGVPQFVRIIPTGGADITHAVKAALETDTDSAESMKRSLGLAKRVGRPEDQRAVEAIYHVAGELLTSLRNTIGYFTNTRPGEPVRSIIITGGGSSMTGLSTALSEITRLPVSEGDPFASVVLGRHLNPDTVRATASSFTVALGLALGCVA